MDTGRSASHLPGIPSDILAQPRVGGNAGGGVQYPAMSVGGGRASAPKSFSEDVPWKTPPANAVDFSIQGTGVTIPAGAPGVETVVGSFTSPQSSKGVIRSVIAVLVGTVTAATVVTFRVKVQGATVPGWEFGAIALPGATSSLIAYGPDETFIKIPPGSLVELTAQSQDATAYTAQMIAKGWTYSITY